MLEAGKTNLGSALFGTAPLTFGMQVACWCLGALSLLVNVALKQIPLDYFAFAKRVDLENDDE